MKSNIEFGQKNDRLDMSGSREKIDGCDAARSIAESAKAEHVPCKRCRVTGNINYFFYSGAKERVDKLRRAALARRVKHNDVRLEAGGEKQLLRSCGGIRTDKLCVSDTVARGVAAGAFNRLRDYFNPAKLAAKPRH